jgi:hypothetical protein
MSSKVPPKTKRILRRDGLYHFFRVCRHRLLRGTASTHASRVAASAWIRGRSWVIGIASHLYARWPHGTAASVSAFSCLPMTQYLSYSSSALSLSSVSVFSSLPYPNARLYDDIVTLKSPPHSGYHALHHPHFVLSSLILEPTCPYTHTPGISCRHCVGRRR